MSEEKKFFYDEIDVKHETLVSFLKGMAIGFGLGMISMFAALATLGIYLGY